MAASKRSTKIGEIPVGGVIAWMSPLAITSTTPPPGWEFCDGTAVTTVGSFLLGQTKPSLMITTGGGAQRFIRGHNLTSGTYGGGAAFTTGGSDSAPVPGLSDPGHSHGAGHSHGGSGSTNNDGSHSHGMSFNTGFVQNRSENSGHTFFTNNCTNLGGEDHNHFVSANTNVDGAHNHSINVNVATSNSGTNTNSTGISLTGGGGDNRPSFVHMVWIVRVL